MMFIHGLNGNVINTEYVQGINIRSGLNVQFAVEALLTDKCSIFLQVFNNGNDANANYQAAQAYVAELYNMLNGGNKS